MDDFLIYDVVEYVLKYSFYFNLISIVYLYK